MLPSISCCAPPIFGLSPLDNFGVIAPDIFKFYIDYYKFCGTPNSTPIRPRVFKLHRNVAQHKLLCTSYFWIISPWQLCSYCPWNIEIYIDYNQFCGTLNSTPIRPRVFNLHSYVAQHKLLCTFYFWIILPLILFELLPLKYWYFT